MKRILFGFVGFVVVVSMSCSLLESTEEELPAPEVSVSEAQTILCVDGSVLRFAFDIFWRYIDNITLRQ